MERLRTLTAQLSLGPSVGKKSVIVTSPYDYNYQVGENPHTQSNINRDKKVIMINTKVCISSQKY